MSKKKAFSYFQRILVFCQKHYFITFFFFSLLFAFSLWGLKFSRFELDIYDVYDRNFQSSVDLNDLKTQYDDHTQILIYFHFPNRPKAHEVCDLIIWSREVAKSADIKNTTSLWSIRAPILAEESLWYKKILDDPCQLPPNQLIELNQKYTTSYFRHLLAKTGSQDLLFDVSFADKKLDIKKVQNVIELTDQYISKKLKNVKIHYLGLAGFRYYFKKILNHDQKSNLLVPLIILLFMRLLYGTWKSGGILIFSLIITNVILYGLIAWFNAPIDILTNNLFLMIAVATTADFFFVTQFQMTGSYQLSLEELIVPSFFTTLTTIVGFLSLNTSDMDLIKRFGNGAALGALLEWMVIFLFLPAFFKVIKKEMVWVNPKKTINLHWILKIENFSLPKMGLYFFLMMMSLSIPSFFFLNDQDSPVENLPKHHQLRESYELFLDKFGWEGQVYLYFPDLPKAQELKGILKDLSGHANIFKIEDPDEVSSDWARGFSPLKQDLIKRELSMGSLWEKYYSHVNTLRIPLYLKQQDLQSLKQLRIYVESLCHGTCRLAGQRVVYLEYGEKISKTMIESFVLSIFLVIMILSYILWKLEKLKYLYAVVISSFMGPLVTLTLMAIFQIQVTVITSIFLAIMVGLAGDNAIQYIITPTHNLEEGIKDRARASILVTLVMILISGLFLLQTLRPVKILGLLFILGFSINLIGDLFGLKGLLLKDTKTLKD
jgi:hypothetical protein